MINSKQFTLNKNNNLSTHFFYQYNYYHQRFTVVANANELDSQHILWIKTNESSRFFFSCITTYNFSFHAQSQFIRALFHSCQHTTLIYYVI